MRVGFINKEDVGQRFITDDKGNKVFITDVLGMVQKCDIGKAVYKNDKGFVSVENEEQMEARKYSEEIHLRTKPKRLTHGLSVKVPTAIEIPARLDTAESIIETLLVNEFDVPVWDADLKISFENGRAVICDEVNPEHIYSYNQEASGLLVGLMALQQASVPDVFTDITVELKADDGIIALFVRGKLIKNFAPMHGNTDAEKKELVRKARSYLKFLTESFNAIGVRAKVMDTL